jgi:hypothetical protein
LDGVWTTLPDSHRLRVVFDKCVRAARSRMLSPAAILSPRRSDRSAFESKRSVELTSRADATRRRIWGRGRDVPSSQRETRSPPATPTRRASSCWVRPARTRAARNASGFNQDSRCITQHPMAPRNRRMTGSGNETNPSASILPHALVVHRSPLRAAGSGLKMGVRSPVDVVTRSYEKSCTDDVQPKACSVLTEV